MQNTNEVYPWILLICTLVVSSLTWGVLFSVGIYYVRWIEYFGSSKAEVAIVGVLSSGTACSLGPVNGLIIERIGFRKAGLIGGCLVAVSHIASAFATNLIYLGIFYGLLFGFGSGLCHLAASVALNQYFIEQRSMAEGIMSMGTGIGTFIWILCNQYLINTYDWKGSLLIMGAIVAHLIILFQLMISPEDLLKIPALFKWNSPERRIIREIRNDIDIKESCYEKTLDCCETEVTSIKWEPQDTKQEDPKSWIRQCLSLYGNPVFILLLTADFTCWLCIYVPYVHLAERSRLQGIDVNTTAWITSTMGLTGIVGRPIMSAIPAATKLNVFYVYGLSNVILGAITIISPFLSSTEGLFIYAGLFGFLSVCVPLGKSSAANLLGIEVFPLAYSWMLLFEGFGIYLGSPLAGWIYDVTLSYDYSFYIMGGGLVFSGLLVTLRNPALRMEKKLRARTIPAVKDQRHRDRLIASNSSA